MLKLTENGQSSLEELTEMRRVFNVVSKYEFLMGEKHYSAVLSVIPQITVLLTPLRECGSSL